MLEALSQALTNKLMHGPTQALSEDARALKRSRVNPRLRAKLDSLVGRLGDLERPARRRERDARHGAVQAPLARARRGVARGRLSFKSYLQAERDADEARDLRPMRR